jgi:hypothetical protein
VTQEVIQNNKDKHTTSHWWLMPVILATWEAKFVRVTVQYLPGQIVPETLAPQ